MSTTNLCTITASVPESLWSTTIKVSINGHTINALLNADSSDCFIDERVNSKLRIKIKTIKKKISMALTTSFEELVYQCDTRTGILETI